MQANHVLPLVLSRGLPKTGQIIQYIALDDGHLQAGWWVGTTHLNLKERFISKRIGSDDVVIDLATGLTWAADFSKAGCNGGVGLPWVDARNWARDLTFAGFDDWRLPNINELASIVDYSKGSPAIHDPPFADTLASYFFSSTTYKPSTTYAWCIYFNDGVSCKGRKVAGYYIRCVRGGL